MWSVALYGAETLTLRNDEKKGIDALEMGIWRRIEKMLGQTGKQMWKC